MRLCILLALGFLQRMCVEHVVQSSENEDPSIDSERVLDIRHITSQIHSTQDASKPRQLSVDSIPANGEKHASNDEQEPPKAAEDHCSQCFDYFDTKKMENRSLFISDDGVSTKGLRPGIWEAGQKMCWIPLPIKAKPAKSLIFPLPMIFT